MQLIDMNSMEVFCAVVEQQSGTALERDHEVEICI